MSHYLDREKNRFFGYGNYANHRNNLITYKSVFDNDNIIVRTNNVTSIITKDKYGKELCQYILIVDNNKYVYLQPWQRRKVSYYDEKNVKHSTSLVKLNRKYFKIYTRKEPFPNILFKTSDDFESLLEHAKIQDIHKMKVEFR